MLEFQHIHSWLYFPVHSLYFLKGPLAFENGVTIKRILRQVTVKNSTNVPLLGIKWVELLEDCMGMIYVLSVGGCVRRLLQPMLGIKGA